ncbi:tetratricopeptide repeat protein [Streptomyces sp. NPDC020983]|uniref:tetratricopeptide repeat protein n=1 Tax=Streptomyces sp. NPDC020983 TaxID=3365106 RepID=UPI00378C4FF6
MGGNVEVHAQDGAFAAFSVRDVYLQAPAGPRAVVWPHAVGVVPPLAGAFQDRAERARLRAAAAEGGTVVLCQVLVGMGGVGKTQLAADYAEHAWDDGHGVDLLVWVTANSRDAVVTAFAQAGAEVCGADPSDPQRAARTLLAWLRTGRRRWLVVLDDVADPRDLNGLRPPAVASGRTVVTTRRRDAARAIGGTAVEVGLFTPGEAEAYLASALAAEGRTEPAADLAGLAGDLGRLPLALSQAAAYVIDAGISAGEYRELLTRRARSLAEISPDVPPDDQTHSMAAAWTLSVEHADRLRPAGLARPVLQLASFLAPGATPAAVLTSTPALDYLTAHRTPCEGPSAGTPAAPDQPVTARDAAAALRALHRLSLLTDAAPPAAHDDGATGATGDAARDGRMVRVHQVVQRATRDTLTPAEYATTARAAGDALLATWPDVERDTELAQALRACTTALIACTETGDGNAGCLYQPDAHHVLYRYGQSLGESGQLNAAIDHHVRLAGNAARHLGPDHPNTLTARGYLADWQGMAGDAAGAVTALAGLLDDQVRVLGPDHPNTLTTRHVLAFWRGEAGDGAGAVTALAGLLDDRSRVLGPDHPDTLTTRGYLARWRGETGDASGAVSAFAGLLHDQVRVLGPDHPDTLTTRGFLAGWRGVAGDAAGAVSAFAGLLDDRLRVLGPDHPDTLTTRHNLAHWRGASGDAPGAATALAGLLDDRLRVLGPDHPDTLTTRHDLAHWRGASGDAPGAATAFTELLHDNVRVLGPDHPRTLAARHSLAHWNEQAEEHGGSSALPLQGEAGTGE